MRVANGGAGLQPGPHLWPNLRALERLAFISPDPPHRVHGDHQAHRRIRAAACLALRPL